MSDVLIAQKPIAQNFDEYQSILACSSTVRYVYRNKRIRFAKHSVKTVQKSDAVSLELNMINFPALTRNYQTYQSTT